MEFNILNCIFELFSWQNITAFLNSNFTAALAGAFAGALAAQKIGDRAKQRNELLQEIRSTNAAIVTSFTICNTGLTLKKQFVKDIYEAYTTKKSELVELKKKHTSGQQSPAPTFEFQADLRELQMPLMPVDILREQIYTHISATGRPLALVSTISGVVASLAETIERRKILIDRFRKQGAPDSEIFAALYFGLQYGPGHVSEEFSDTVESLHMLTDDVIYFSELLAKDLIAHGKQILEQYKKVAKIKKEKIHSLDLTEAREEGLMPDETNYINWLRGFPDSAQPDIQPDR